MEKKENTIKKKLEVYDRGQMYLMKLLDNYQDVPGTKKDLQCHLFECLLIWPCDKQETVFLDLLALKQLY